MDESGDAGFKLGVGSTPTLVVAAVIFDEAAHAEVTAERIHQLRRELQVGDRFQFHFSDLKREWRERFCHAIRLFPFRVRAIVMDKQRIYEDSLLRRRGDYFYNFAVKLLLKHTFGTVRDAKVFIDGEAGRESLRRMVAYLRQECNTEKQRVIAEVKFVPKRENNSLLQLADMVTSSLARSYRTDKEDRNVYRRLLAPRLQDVWEFGLRR